MRTHDHSIPECSDQHIVSVALNIRDTGVIHSGHDVQSRESKQLLRSLFEDFLQHFVDDRIGRIRIKRPTS